MSDGITDAERMKRQEVEMWRKKAKEQFIAELTTKELVDELSKREGITTYPIDPYIKYVVEDETGIYTQDTGPARILVVID